MIVVYSYFLSSDIKGGNILVTESGTIKLADFGSSFYSTPTAVTTVTAATPARSLSTQTYCHKHRVAASVDSAVVPNNTNFHSECNNAGCNNAVGIAMIDCEETQSIMCLDQIENTALEQLSGSSNNSHTSAASSEVVYCSRRCVGTPYFMAPDVLVGERYLLGLYRLIMLVALQRLCVCCM